MSSTFNGMSATRLADPSALFGGESASRIAVRTTQTGIYLSAERCRKRIRFCLEKFCRLLLRKCGNWQI